MYNVLADQCSSSDISSDCAADARLSDHLGLDAMMLCFMPSCMEVLKGLKAGQKRFCLLKKAAMQYMQKSAG